MILSGTARNPGFVWCDRRTNYESSRSAAGKEKRSVPGQKKITTIRSCGDDNDALWCRGYDGFQAVGGWDVLVKRYGKRLKRPVSLRTEQRKKGG